MEHGHVPVLLDEVLALVRLSPRAAILDVTLGLGGHAEAFLRTDPDVRVVGLDADAENLLRASERLEVFGSRVQCIHANFHALPGCLPPEDRAFDVIFADLGLSSPHVDDPARGFSWRFDAPLDMRFDRSSGKTAALVLGSYDLSRLTELFSAFGELPQSRSLARAILAARTSQSILTTCHLKDIVSAVYGYRATRYLPQVFQALRMEVNDELTSLNHLLDVAPRLLQPGGVLVVISFHSLEDRLVKRAFRTLSQTKLHPVTGAQTAPAEYVLLTKRPVRPTLSEADANPRSRSASMRALQRSGVYTSSRSSAC